MPKITLLKEASRNKVIQINSGAIKIEYFQNDTLCPFLVYGAIHLGTNTKVYILEIRKDAKGVPLYPGINALRNFKKETTRAHLILNSDIPDGWKLNLSSVMPTCITGHLGRRIEINSELSLTILGNIGAHTIINAPQKAIMGIIEPTPPTPTVSVHLPISRPASAPVPTPTSTMPTTSSIQASTIQPDLSGDAAPNKRRKIEKDLKAEHEVPNWPRPDNDDIPIVDSTVSAAVSASTLDNGAVSSIDDPKSHGNSSLGEPKRKLSPFTKKSSPPTSHGFRNLFLPKTPKTSSIPVSHLTSDAQLSASPALGTVPGGKLTTLPLPMIPVPVLRFSSGGATVSVSTPPAMAPTSSTTTKALSKVIKNNIPNIEQQKLGNEKFKAWIELHSSLRCNTELEDGEVIEDDAVNNTDTCIEQHQFRAFKEYYLARLNGQLDAVVEWATGAGKTFLFSKLPEILGEKFFIGVSLITLEDQTAASIEKFSPTLAVGKLRDCTDTSKAGIRRFFKKYDVVIGTHQLLRLNKKYEKLPFDIISTFVLDEAHNGLTQKTEDLFKFEKSKNTAIMSFTATPRIRKKVDGRDNVYHFLGFNDPILKETSNTRKHNPITLFTLREAVDEGVCAPVVTALIIPKNAKNLRFTHRTKNGTLKKLTDASNISENDATRVIDKEEYNNIIVDVYMNGRDTYTVGEGTEKRTVFGSPFRGEQGMVYCAGIVHSDHMAQAFNKVPIDVFDNNSRLRLAYENNIYLDMVNLARKSYERKKKVAPQSVPTSFSLTPEQDNKLKQDAHSIATTGKTKFCIAKAIHSRLPMRDRQAAIKKFKLGGICIATGDSMLAEGLDHPPASLIFITSNIHSEKSLLQKAGRGGRRLRGETVPTEKEKIWRVFNMVWPTLKKSKHFYMYLSENGDVEPKFTRGNDKIKAIREAYLASQTNSNNIGASAANMTSIPQINIPVMGSTSGNGATYEILWDATQEKLDNLFLKCSNPGSDKKSRDEVFNLSFLECIDYIQKATGDNKSATENIELTERATNQKNPLLSFYENFLNQIQLEGIRIKK